jgi:hypothetical protein
MKCEIELLHGGKRNRIVTISFVEVGRYAEDALMLLLLDLLLALFALGRLGVGLLRL